MVDAVGTTHHVKINGQFYLVRQGTYRKTPGPGFGARFTTGDPDFNNLSFWQHWVQRCWVGGFGAPDWMDDSMFDEGAGIDSTQDDVLVLSRDMGGAGTGFALNSATTKTTRRFVEFNDELYVVVFGTNTTSILYKWNRGTLAWNLIRTFPEVVRSVEVFSGHLVFGMSGANIERMSTAEAFTNIDKPDSVDAHTPYTMRTYRGRLYVGFSNQIWRLKPDWLWDGSTNFYTAEESNYLISSEVHLGQLYFASQNGHVLRTDANNTFDIWAFDPGVRITSLRSFDGRLFVATTEPLDGTTAQQAVLYQFTGSAITELKRWGKVGQDITIGQLRTVGRRMMFGAGSLLGMRDGFGVAAYDPREDAYHMWATNMDGTTYPGGTEGINWSVDDVAYYRGWLWASVRGFGIFRTKYSYKDVTRYQATYDNSVSGGAVGPLNGGWYTSSDFDAGTPGLLKLFNAITLEIDLPTIACTALVEYSLDGGLSWGYAGGTLASATVGGSAPETGRVRKRIMFQGGGLRSVRLKYRITLRTTDVTRSPQLRSVVVRYLPIPEPNWQWQMQLVLSERQELLDHTREVPNVQTLDATAIGNKLTALETPFRSQALVNFIDVDGTEWTSGGGAGVLITNLSEEMPVPGPNSDGPKERIIAVTLLEAVEAYA